MQIMTLLYLTPKNCLEWKKFGMLNFAHLIVAASHMQPEKGGIRL